MHRQLLITLAAASLCACFEGPPDPCALVVEGDLPSTLEAQLTHPLAPEADGAIALERSSSLSIVEPEAHAAWLPETPPRVRFRDDDSHVVGAVATGSGVTGNLYLVRVERPGTCPLRVLTASQAVNLPESWVGRITGDDTTLAVHVDGAFFVDGHRSGQLREGASTTVYLLRPFASESAVARSPSVQAPGS